MRLTILNGSKNSHEIQLCGGQLAGGMHPLDCKYTILSFAKMLIVLTACMGRGGLKREGARIKRAGHYLIQIYIIYSG